MQKMFKEDIEKMEKNVLIFCGYAGVITSIIVIFHSMGLL